MHRISRHAVAALVGLVLLLPAAGVGSAAGIGPGAAAGATRVADDPARVVQEQRIDARTLDLTVTSPEIDAPVAVRLLLPPSWSKTATRTWPVLWLLHGGSGDHTDWTAHTHIEELAAPRDVLVVLPQTSPCSGYSDWYNSGGGGPPAWETYLVDELRPLLESQYRAGTERAVAGLSMGGLGAMKLAALHPGMFRAVASYSGAVSTLHLSLDGGLSGPDLVKGAGAGCHTDWRRIWGEPGFPFDTTDPTDLRRRSVWERNDPLHQAAGLAGTALYISYGDGTDAGTGWQWGHPPASPARCTNPIAGGAERVEHLIHGMNQDMLVRLAQLGVPAAVCSYRGVHAWPYWERELVFSFPGLMAAIGA
ncbi:alpha/beta hydrolase [Streptomyces sp. NPDC085929]|uniref:alpha/beta hydrolase n=1 Tax=Streptomyces sp. NPDC085929 TaxID=3365739 RepID=UPI0037D4BF16